MLSDIFILLSFLFLPFIETWRLCRKTYHSCFHKLNHLRNRRGSPVHNWNLCLSFANEVSSPVPPVWFGGNLVWLYVWFRNQHGEICSDSGAGALYVDTQKSWVRRSASSMWKASWVRSPWSVQSDPVPFSLMVSQHCFPSGVDGIWHHI